MSRTDDIRARLEKRKANGVYSPHSGLDAECAYLLARLSRLEGALRRLEKVATEQSGLLDRGWLGGEFAGAIIEARAALEDGE